jgi:hypothetical protein
LHGAVNTVAALDFNQALRLRFRREVAYGFTGKD